MMREENAKYESELASIRERTKAAEAETAHLKKLREEDSLELEHYEKVLKMADEMGGIKNATVVLAEATVQRTKKYAERLDTLLEKFRLYAENDDGRFIDFRIRFVQLKRELVDNLRNVIDGKNGLVTYTDTPESLTKELQKRNELQRTQASLFEFALQEMSQVTHTLGSKMTGGISTKDHIEVLRWQKDIVNKLNLAWKDKESMRLDYDKPDREHEKLSGKSKGFEAEIENLKQELAYERTQNDEARSKVTLLENDNASLRQSQLTANVAATASESAQVNELRVQVEDFRKQLREGAEEKSRQADEISKLKSQLSSASTALDHTSKIHSSLEDRQTKLEVKHNSLLDESDRHKAKVIALTEELLHLKFAANIAQTQAEVAQVNLDN